MKTRFLKSNMALWAFVWGLQSSCPAEMTAAEYAMYLMESGNAAFARGDVQTAAIFQALALRADPGVKIDVAGPPKPPAPEAPVPGQRREAAQGDGAGLAQNEPHPAASSRAPAHREAEQYEQGTEAIFPMEKILTDVHGRKIESTILGAGGGMIRFRRKSDSKEFSLPIERLSPADMEFFLKLAKRPGRSTP